MELTRSVPPLVSEERHRGSSDITSRGKATATATTTRSKQTTCNPFASLVARYRQVAPGRHANRAKGTLLRRGASTAVSPPFPVPLGTARRNTAEEHVRTHVRQREGLLFPSRFARNRESATRIDGRPTRRFVDLSLSLSLSSIRIPFALAHSHRTIVLVPASAGA